jgi:hypothetical protein
MGKSGVTILDFKTSFYQHFANPLTGYHLLGDRSFWNISPTFRGPTQSPTRVLLASANRLEGEDTLLVLKLRMCEMYLHVP